MTVAKRRYAVVLAWPVLAVAVFIGVAGCPSDPIAPRANCASFRNLGGLAGEPSVVNVFFQLTTCTGKPLAGITAEEYLIREDGQEVSLFESQQQYTTTPRCYTSAAVLMLDLSGSILASGNLPALQEAATQFATIVAPSQPVVLLTFDGRSEVQVLNEATDDVDELAASIASLSTYQVVDVSTNLNGAVVQGLAMLDQVLAVDQAQSALRLGTLVVFTDGTDQAARVSDAEAVAQTQASEHDVYTLGLGVEIDPSHLQALGKSGSYFADNVEGLSEAFDRAAQDIQNAANSYYELSYCTPKRAGTHTLELSLRGWSGSLTYQFNADGFEGGCNPLSLVDAPCTPPSNAPDDP